MKRVIVFRSGQLGDSLITLPALHLIRRHFPDAEVSYLYDFHQGESYVVSRDLLEKSGLVTHFIKYSCSSKFKDKIRVFFSRVLLLLKLRQGRFDLLIHLEPDVRTRWQVSRDRIFFSLAGIRRFISCSRYRGCYHLGQDLRAEHEADFFLRALRMEGFSEIAQGAGCMSLELGEQDRREYIHWLTLKGLRCLPERSVVVGVGSKMQSKIWPTDRYLAVIRRLIDSHQIVPVFLGGSGDQDIAEDSIRQLGCGINACGDLSLRGSAYAAQNCLLYLGNDTGTMHLAVASGLKCVAVFSARDVPGRWYPYGEGHEVHRKSVDCQGCMLQECQEQDHRCLMAIQPEEVYESCVRVMKGRARHSNHNRV